LPCENEQSWQGVPLIGWVIAAYLCHRRYRRHEREVLIPIERQIVEQLVRRRGATPCANGSLQTEVAQMVAEAVGKEKSIPQPAIHPEDPIELLFWGAYDDMSPLQFTIALRRRFGITVTSEDITRYCQGHWKVEDVINDCVTRIQRVHGMG
jgi:hypothetical protein